jgi:xanthine/CO dehydrogenase XdhC/CoxF family maturation factor
MNLSETAEVLEAISRLKSEDRALALATIVSVHGSTYRRPGARLLVPEEGPAIGNLSGGCLEGDVEELARDVMASGETRLKTYDLTAEDEAVWGWGLGCNGTIEVFIEPARRAAETADVLRTALNESLSLAVATVIESDSQRIEPGARLVLYPSGQREGSLGHSSLDEAAVSACESSLGAGITDVVEVDSSGGRARLFVEVLKPPLRLLVCGAGHDAIPLVAQASNLGWRVEVIDDRSAFLDSERFPGAHHFVNTTPGEAAGRTNPDSSSYVVVMSHNYLRDRDYLRSFLGSEAAYIGMLGPRARLSRLLDDLASEGVRATDDQVERVYGPAGLDLGGEGPEEIAAAIVAEILAMSRGRPAGPLRRREGPIHERPEPVGI